jgi:hypothetical protein
VSAKPRKWAYSSKACKDSQTAQAVHAVQQYFMHCGVAGTDTRNESTECMLLSQDTTTTSCEM